MRIKNIGFNFTKPLFQGYNASLNVIIYYTMVNITYGMVYIYFNVIFVSHKIINIRVFDLMQVKVEG